MRPSQAYREGHGVEFVGLVSSVVDRSENFRQAAIFVDKVLKGAKPGDLPIEFPTKPVLVINVKNANPNGDARPC